MQLWESPFNLLETLRSLRQACTVSSFSAGFVAALMGVTGPSLLVYQAAVESDFTQGQIASWFFAIFALSGVFSVVLSIMYRQPICGAYSIAGCALLVHALPQFGLHLAVGAYIMGSVLILLLGVTGLFGRLMALFPMEVIMGMLVGVLLQFAIAIWKEMVLDPLLIAPTILAFLLATRWQKGLPPIMVALTVGVVLALVFHPLPTVEIPLALTLPGFYMPAFSLDAFLTLTLPLVLLTLSSQNASGIGVLMAFGYKAPVHAITLATGFFSLITAPMAGHGVNLATPMTALCGAESAHPNKDLRWGASVVNGLFFILAGIFGRTLVVLIEVLPLGLIRVISGLALMPVIIQALERTFSSGRHRTGGFFALVISASNVSWLGVGSAFWGLVLATLLTRILGEAKAARS